jgi:hypothetical protein
MTEFELDPAGQRTPTRYGRDDFRMLADFARPGRLIHPYGDAAITKPSAADSELSP